MINLKYSKADRVRFVRALTQLSRQKFCAEHNIAYATLSLWENRKYKNGNGLSYGGAQIIVNALQAKGINCSLAWLFNGDGNAPKAKISLDRSEITSGFNIAKSALKLPYIRVKSKDMGPKFPENCYVFYQEISLQAVINHNAYIVIDNKKQVHFNYIIKEKASLVLYNNKPAVSKQVVAERIFKPILVCT